MANDIIDTTIDANTNAQELTLVDIEELRRALGAEALLLAPVCDGGNSSTCMCPQWY